MFELPSQGHWDTTTSEVSFCIHVCPSDHILCYKVQQYMSKQLAYVQSDAVLFFFLHDGPLLYSVV